MRIYRTYRKAQENGERPWEKDEESFMQYHDTGRIDSNAYEKYNTDGGLAWLGGIEKNPELHSTETFGDKTIEFRQSGEKLRYVTHSEDDEILREPNGDPIYETDESILARGGRLYDSTIIAYHDGKPIGFASDEWGADGVWVEPSYQKLGIGVHLLKLLRDQFKPEREIGQMTYEGQQMSRAYYRKYVQPQV